LGHTPHEIFVLIKLKVAKNGEGLAHKLQTILNDVLQLGKDLAPDFEAIFNSFRISSRYYDGFLYLVMEVDHGFFDVLVAYANEIIQSLSPECNFEFKVGLTSNVSNLLKESFSYE